MTSPSSPSATTDDELRVGAADVDLARVSTDGFGMCELSVPRVAA